MGLVLLVLFVLFILGVICYLLDKDPSKPTWDDVKEDISEFKGFTAPIFILLYSIVVILTFLIYPIKIIEYIKKTVYNPWKPFPKYTPKYSGRYMCTVNGESEASNTIILYWCKEERRWRNVDRFDVFNTYQVFVDCDGPDGEPAMTQITYDKKCVRNDVIAFKRLPKAYNRNL